MEREQIFYYLKSKDLAEVFSVFSDDFDIELVKTGLFDSCTFDRVDIKQNNSVLYEVPTGDWVKNNTYLMIPKGSEIVVREIQQKKGGCKYAIDGWRNTESLLIVVGGEYEDNVLIAGRIDLVSEGTFPVKAFKLLKKLISKKSNKVKGWYVSKELTKGSRLTTSISSPLEYDLLF